MTCTDFEELSGAYVLDAITPEERKEAEEHLVQCSKCTHLLQELRSVVDLLPWSVQQVEPSPALKERILSSIQAEAASRPTQRTQAQRVPPTPLQERRRPSQRRWLTPLLAAAAILMFLLSSGMAAWNVSLQQQTALLQQQVASLSTSKSIVTYAVAGTSANLGITGEITYFPKKNITVLVIHGLPPLQGTHVYQGWLLQGKQTISIGLMNVRGTVATIDFQGNVKGYDAAAISAEKGPTASPNAPKGPVVAVGSLAHPTSNV